MRLNSGVLSYLSYIFDLCKNFGWSTKFLLFKSWTLQYDKKTKNRATNMRRLMYTRVGRYWIGLGGKMKNIHPLRRHNRSFCVYLVNCPVCLSFFWLQCVDSHGFSDIYFWIVWCFLNLCYEEMFTTAWIFLWLDIESLDFLFNNRLFTRVC